MATLSILVKALLTNRVNYYGLVDTDATEADGTRVLIVAPNRFGPGYVRIVSPALGNWSADFSKTGTLRQPTQARAFAEEA